MKYKSKKINLNKLLGKINKIQAEKIFIQYMVDKDLIKHAKYVGFHNMLLDIFEDTWETTQKKVNKTGIILTHKNFMDILGGKGSNVFQE